MTRKRQVCFPSLSTTAISNVCACLRAKRRTSCLLMKVALSQKEEEQWEDGNSVYYNHMQTSLILSHSFLFKEWHILNEDTKDIEDVKAARVFSATLKYLFAEVYIPLNVAMEKETWNKCSVALYHSVK